MRVTVRVLGVDPGSRFLGYGLVDVDGGRVRYAGHGVVCADPARPLAERLVQLFEALRVVIDAHHPESMAVEGVFSHKNARSALVLGHARGVVLLAAAQAGLPVMEYAPARVKRSVGAGGAGSKGSIARMVTRLLELDRPLSRADAYDALAVALCHAHALKSPFLPTRARAGVRSTGLDGEFARRLRPAVTVRAGGAR